MNWLDKLKEYAPDIATAVLTGGASLPQMAIKAIADATGVGMTTESELGNFIKGASPDTMLKVKQANNSFKIRMAELANELTATELGDVQHAREQHKHSKMPAIICVVLTIMVACIIAALFRLAVPDANKALVFSIVGQVLTLWGGSVVYWIGTTRSSATKTIMMGVK